jgi:ATP-dependent DNA ligase
VAGRPLLGYLSLLHSLRGSPHTESACASCFIRPLIPSSTKSPPKGSEWLHEPKWDGYRFQVVKNGLKVRLFSKSGAEYTNRLPYMVANSPRRPRALRFSMASYA